MRRRIGFVLIAVLAAAAACGGGGSGSKKSSPARPADTTPPRPGGTLTIGLDAETDGWNPVTSQWSGAGYTVGSAIFDPLIAPGADGKPHPYLAQSVTPSPDYRKWTITLRPNIKFHDGEPLDAKAVALQLNLVKASFLSAQLLRPMMKITAIDDLNVEVEMSEPWVAFPVALASQVGYIAAPKQLNASAEESGKHPIGTGPYSFKEWQRDDHLTADKNPDYWQKGKPYPAKVVFRVVPEPQSRVAALESGELDYTTSTLVTDILRFRKDDSVNMIENLPDRPNFIMFNTTKKPVDDVRVRRALALATDQVQLEKVLGRGTGEIADGPYRKNSPWYSASGYPIKPDLAEAKKLISAYKADNGVTGDVALTFGCTPVGTNRQYVDLLKAQWAKVGVKATPKFTEQAVYINDAISGNFQANCWTQFGTPDPDLDATWWLSQNAEGPIALNFARHKDSQVDASLIKARENPDPTVRKAEYAKVWKRFAQRVPYLWTGRGVTGLLYSDRLHIDSTFKLPDGKEPQPPKLLGSIPIVAMWLGK